MKTPAEVAENYYPDQTATSFTLRSIIEEVIREDRKQIARILQAGADEWEATGDDEKFVNEVVDPFIVEVLR